MAFMEQQKQMCRGRNRQNVLMEFKREEFYSIREVGREIVRSKLRLINRGHPAMGHRAWAAGGAAEAVKAYGC